MVLAREEEEVAFGSDSMQTRSRSSPGPADRRTSHESASKQL